MSFTVKGYYTVQVDEEYEDEADAYARAREIVTDHPNAAAYVDGGGVWASFNASNAQVEA